MWERKNGLEDSEIDLAAQKTLEGWRVAGEPLEEVVIKLALTPTSKQERPTAELLPKPADGMINTSTSKTSSVAISTKDRLKTNADSHLDKLTAQAFSLLGS